MNLRATDHPEFDAWRWNDYWVPLDVVIEFKRDVYQMALTELARFLPRGAHHNRYLRSGMRAQRARRDDAPPRASVPRQPAHGDARLSALPSAEARPRLSTRLSRWISSGSLA